VGVSDEYGRTADAAARLQAAVDELQAEVSALPDDLVTWKPAADVWSVMEILCHVAEFVPYWTGQTQQAAAHPDRLWGRDHKDTARIDAVNRAGARSLSEVLAEIRAGTLASTAAIRRLRDADLDVEAVSHNPRWGRQPASFVLEHLVIEHVTKHTGQIRRNVTQFRERQEGSR
jgi:uncharacterized damage-inducible protein DinB